MITIETIYYFVAITGIIVAQHINWDTKMVRMQENNRPSLRNDGG